MQASELEVPQAMLVEVMPPVVTNSVVATVVPLSLTDDAAILEVVPDAFGITLAAMIDDSPTAQPMFVVWSMMSKQCSVESLYQPYCVEVPVNAVPSVA